MMRLLTQHCRQARLLTQRLAHEPAQSAGPETTAKRGLCLSHTHTRGSERTGPRADLSPRAPRAQMARTLLLLSLAGVAAAFVPARELSARARAAPARAAVSMKVDGLIGAIPPMGYFDPLGLSKGKTLEQMKQFREVERVGEPPRIRRDMQGWGRIRQYLLPY